MNSQHQAGPAGQCGHALTQWGIDPGAMCVRPAGHEHAHLYWKGHTPIVWDRKAVCWATPEGAFAAINGLKWDPGWLRDDRIAQAIDDWPVQTHPIDPDDLAGGQS